MAIDPNIKKKADDIRNKIYGKEVRESLASGLEAMSTDVVENTGRQDNVESQFQDVIENTTDKDVISAPEIIAARNGEANLKARLDKEKNEVTALLAHKAEKSSLEGTNKRIDELIVGSGDANVEVTDAHVSVTKNKSFDTISNRFEEVEKTTYIPATNLIENAFLEQTRYPWNTGSATVSYNENELVLEGSASIIPYYPFTRTVGHKYYGAATIELLNGETSSDEFFVGGISSPILLELNTPKTFSRLGTATSVGGSILQFIIKPQNGTAKVAISNPLALDLTEIFGVGNEPTKEEMDSLVKQFPNSFFMGTTQLISFKEFLTQTNSNLRNKVDQATLEEALSSIDLDAVLQKQDDKITVSFTDTTEELSLATIVYDDVTLEQLFTDKNIIPNSHFNDGLNGFKVLAGTPAVTSSVYNTKNRSLNVSGSSSQQIGLDSTVISVPNNRTYFVAARVRVDRHTSGGGIGFQINDSTHPRKTLTYVTDGFETISLIYTASNFGSLALGGIESNNADGYLDDFMMIDITDAPKHLEMARLYEAYLTLLNGQSTSVEYTREYEIKTKEIDPITLPDDAINTFMNKVNEKAREIGMTNSHFNNPAGGDINGISTTARDLIKLGIHATGYDDLLKVWNKKTYDIKVMGDNARTVSVISTVKSPNLEDYYYVIGGKTGTTSIQNLLVIVNTPENDWLVGAILDARSERFTIAKELFDIGRLNLEDGYSGTHDVNADKAAVALVPNHNPFAYTEYDIPLLWGKNEDVKGVPASVAKVITVITALDYVDNLEEKIILKKTDITTGSGSAFFEGDTVTVRDALHAAMLESSNTLITALARTAGEKILRYS